MADFKRIMVGLDLTDIDDRILEYTAMIKESFNPEVIYFIHVEENLEIPEEVMKELGLDSNNPGDEELKNRLMEKVAGHMTEDENCELHYRVVEGSAFEKILHWSHIKKVDLLIVGKKIEADGKGVLPSKLARKIDASVLFVPDTYEVKPIDKIVIPVDFSKKSIQTIRMIDVLFGDKIKDLLISHCYTLPMGWYKTGKSKEQFIKIMSGHARRKYEEMMEKVGELSGTPTPHFKLDENQEPSKEIVEIAEEANADLIAIPTRGKTDAATIILGSTTEKLLVNDRNIPLLMIKEKGETIGFLEALFRLK